MHLSDLPEEALQNIVVHLVQSNFRGLHPAPPLDALPLAETGRLFRRVVSNALVKETAFQYPERRQRAKTSIGIPSYKIVVTHAPASEPSGLAPFLAWVRLGQDRLRDLSLPRANTKGALAIFNALARCNPPLVRLDINNVCHDIDRKSVRGLLRDFFGSVRGSLKSLRMNVRSDIIVGVVIEANLVNVDVLQVESLGRGELGKLVKVVKSLHPRIGAAQSALRTLNLPDMGAEEGKMLRIGKALAPACPNVTDVLIGVSNHHCRDPWAALGLVQSFKVLRSLNIENGSGHEMFLYPGNTLRPFFDRTHFPHLSAISLHGIASHVKTTSWWVEAIGSRLRKVKLGIAEARHIRSIGLNCTSLTHLDVGLHCSGYPDDQVSALLTLCENRALEDLRVRMTGFYDSEKEKLASAETVVRAIEACGPTLSVLGIGVWCFRLARSQLERIMAHTGANLSQLLLSYHESQPHSEVILSIIENATNYNPQLRFLELRSSSYTIYSKTELWRMNRALDLLEQSAIYVDTSQLRKVLGHPSQMVPVFLV